jgi:hypothetical protein
VNVVDPVRRPGEVVILYPVNGSGFSPGAGGEEISLVGYATYADGTSVPETRLYWTDSSGTEIGTGSSTAATIHGHCRDNEYKFTLTARQADGTPVGTRSVTIRASAPPC